MNRVVRSRRHRRYSLRSLSSVLFSLSCFWVYNFPGSSFEMVESAVFVQTASAGYRIFAELRMKKVAVFSILTSFLLVVAESCIEAASFRVLVWTWPVSNQSLPCKTMGAFSLYIEWTDF